MEQFLESQQGIYNKIRNSYVLLMKRPADQKTAGATQVLMRSVEKYWEKYDRDHYTMMASDKADKENAYFTSGTYDTVEQEYLIVLGKLQEYLNSFDQSKQPGADSSIQELTSKERDGFDEAQLEKITVPTFSGKIEDWMAFKALFKPLVLERQGFKTMSKFQFLHMKVKGEALDMIKDIEFTEPNFETAWNKLVEFYENKRRLINTHLTTLLSLKPMSSETSAEVTRILRGTNGPLSALEALGRPTNTWDDIIVFLTFSKLSTSLKRDWEMQLGKSANPPTFKEMSDFLQAKVDSFTNLENAEKTHFAQPYSFSTSSKSHQKPPQNKVKNFQVTSEKQQSKQFNAKCSYCGQDHVTYSCVEFLKLDPHQRFDFIKLKRRCFNCFGKHFTNSCDKEKRCKKCQGKHHTLLHFNDTTTVTTHVNQGGCSSKSNPSEVEGQTSSTNVAVALSELSSVNIAECNNANPSTNLLATAWVIVENETGNQQLVRAMVDPCSQATFIATNIFQKLKLPKQGCTLIAEGFNDSMLANCKIKTKFTIKPHFTSDFSCQINAYVSPKVCSYRPRVSNDLGEWSHLQGLTLADPQYSETGVIDLLLGVNAYSCIVQDGLIQGPPGPLL